MSKTKEQISFNMKQVKNKDSEIELSPPSFFICH